MESSMATTNFKKESASAKAARVKQSAFGKQTR